MNVRIWIVDSGGAPGAENSRVFRNGSLYPDEVGDRFGHGTAVSGIIGSGAPTAELTHVRLVNQDAQATADELTALLVYMDAHADVDLIHMSLGVTGGDLQALHTACVRLAEKGVILVAAFDNGGAISYPAAFPEVIGVSSNPACRRKDAFRFCDDSVLNLLAHGNVQRVRWTDPKYLLITGNSFAAAHVTAWAANEMSRSNHRLTRADLLERFRKAARDVVSFGSEPLPQKLPFEIRRAVLFPFNKEMHALIRFRDLLPFEIVGVYEGRYAATIGTSVSQLVGTSGAEDLMIRKLSDCDFDSFDMAVIGHCGELARLVDPSLMTAWIRRLAAHGKNIYSFDDLSDLLPGFSYERWFYPHIKRSDLPPDRCGKLFRIQTPVLGVFGTSSKQGKFTLQLALRKRLMAEGYRVGQIGTEPTALLFGMERCYPMGYASSVEVSGTDAVRWLNHAMNDISEDKDILIVGSQSGTIPFSCDNTAYFCFPQQEFLLGTQPDAILLCINPYDEPDYIGKTIQMLEAADATVIGLAVFPMTFQSELNLLGKRRLTQEEETHLLQLLRQQFDLPAWIVRDPADVEEIADCVTRFFTTC